ncbi:MAG: hypothetical protein H0V34_12615 [Gammaproteobacteria bacterium]|nr:hypothetical protein [Gammaproteobacteria bacterium]
MGTSPSTIYTFNLTTGAATGIALSLPATTPPVAGSGDIAFNAAGTLDFVGESVAGDATSVRLWSINLTTNTVANVGAITGLPNVANGISFDNSGGLYLSLTSQTRLYTAPAAGGASSAVGASGAMPALTDLSTKDVPQPDLSITKTDGRSLISAGSAQTYTIQVINSSSYPVAGTVTDTVPASLTGVTWTCSASSGSSCAAASGNGNTLNTSATLASGGTATYTVSGALSALATGTLSNTASVAVPAWLTDATPANNSATDTTTITQNPTIAKAFSPPTINANGTSTLSFTLTNNNATAQTNLSFTDSYSAGLVNATPLNIGGTCAGVTTTAVAGGSTFNVTGGSIPGGSPGSCTITVAVTSAANGTYSNTTSGVTTTQYPTPGAPSNTATLTVSDSPPTIAKSFSPATIQTSGTSILRLTVTNPSTTTTLTGVAVADTYPANLVNRNPANATLNCTAGSSGTLTGGANGGNSIGLTGASILAGGNCELTVRVTSATNATYTNTTGNVTSTNGGSGGNAAATLTVQAGLVPPVISKKFVLDELGVSGVSALTFTIRNPNNNALDNITFSDTYPAGLVNAATPSVSSDCDSVAGGANGVSGGAAAGDTIGLTGTNNDRPANSTCTVTVNVTSATAGVYNNVSGAAASTSGGGPSNTAADTITFVRPTIAKAFSPATISAGGVSTLTITLTNASDVNFTAAAFTDTFPTSPGALTVASPLTTGNSCGGTLQDNGGGALGAGDADIRLSNGVIPALGSCAITVNVTATVAGAHTNTIAAGGLTTSGGTSAGAASAILTVASPSLTVAKTAQTLSDPVNGAVNPKAIPGAFVNYSITVNNPGSGAVDANSVFVTDSVPANSDLFVANLGAVGSGPIAFNNGAPSSGLSYTFTSLSDTTDDVSFSNAAACTTFSYTPTPNANGVDSQVCQIRVNPKGTFNANSSFQVTFRVRLE